MIKQKLTEIAVDAFTDYLREKVEALKQLDLDKDGRKDVDQLGEALARCGVIIKASIQSTNFPQIAGGIEQIMNGMTQIGSAVDKEKLKLLGSELSDGLSTLAHLSKLSIEYVKEQQPPEQS